jgi:hypothetical protein
MYYECQASPIRLLCFQLRVSLELMLHNIFYLHIALTLRCFLYLDLGQMPSPSVQDTAYLALSCRFLAVNWSEDIRCAFLAARAESSNHVCIAQHFVTI